MLCDSCASKNEHPLRKALEDSKRKIDEVLTEIESCVAAVDGEVRCITPGKGTALGVGITSLRGYVDDLNDRAADLDDGIEDALTELETATKSLKEREAELLEVKKAMCNYIMNKKSKRAPEGCTRVNLLEKTVCTVNACLTEISISTEELEEMLKT